MKVLIFDTETDGLPLSFKISAEDDWRTWPNIVQICAQLYDTETEQKIKEMLYIVLPVGYKIPANMIHGISHEKALKEGVNLVKVLTEFEHLVKESDFVVAHNYEFDYNVITAAFLSIGEDSPLLDKKSLCTMKATTNICRISGGYRGSYKWPRLDELYYFLFKKDFEAAHSANGDVDATASCYFALRKTYNIDKFMF